MATEKKKGAGLSWLSAILIIVGMVLTPAAVVSHWATSQVTNTENFVKTLSPLASNPAVQNVIIDEITGLIEEKVDVQSITESLFTGLGDALNLPDAAKQALGLVVDPLASGIEGMIKGLVEKAVKSDAFQQAWTKTLTLTQEQTIALLSGDPNSVVQLSNDGTLTLPLKPIIVDVKKALLDQGVTFAKFIPEVDKDITLGQIPELALARVIYQVGVGVGTWLPWIVAAFFLVGIALARRRPRAMLATGVVFALVNILMVFTFTTGRVLATTLIESTYSTAVGVIYDAVVGYVISVVSALIALGIIGALVGWAFGESAPAASFRAFANKQMDALRKAIDPNNKVFVKVSPVLHQYRIGARALIIVLAALPVAFMEPMTTSTVLWSAFWGLVVLFVYEVLQRHITAAPAAAARVSAPAPTSPAAPSAVAQKPAAKKSASAKPAAKKATASKPAAKKAVAKKPVAKKPATKKS